MNIQDQKTHETLAHTFLRAHLSYSVCSSLVKEEGFSEFIEAVHRDGGNIRTLYKKRMSGLSSFIIASMAAHLVMGHTVVVMSNNNDGSQHLVNSLFGLIGKSQVNHYLKNQFLKIAINNADSLRGHHDRNNSETTYVYVDNANFVSNKGLVNLISSVQAIYKKELRLVLCGTAEEGTLIDTKSTFGQLRHQYVDQMMKKYLTAN